MKTFIINIFVGILFLISNIKSIDFYFTIDQFTHKCLGEYLTEHTTGNIKFTLKIFPNIKNYL